jgi:hypothetical protein
MQHVLIIPLSPSFSYIFILKPTPAPPLNHWPYKLPLLFIVANKNTPSRPFANDNGPTIWLAGGVMVFCFIQKCFFGQHELEYFFLSRIVQIFPPQNLTLGYMTKTLNQIFFPPPKSSAHDAFQYQNIGKQNNLKVSGSNKPKALNRMPRSTKVNHAWRRRTLAKICYSHICLSITHFT